MDQRLKVMTREEVYEVISGERAYQDKQAAKWNNKGFPTLEAEILMMSKYMRDVQEAWTDNSDNSVPKDLLRKVVAMGIRVFENHGVPSRYGERSKTLKYS